MTKQRQLEATVGLSHDGFEFLKGSFDGLKGYAVGRMTKSRRGKLYIDDAGWGPEAGSIEYGYRVHFCGIHVFIGKLGELGPEPDICTDIIETAQHGRPARAQSAVKRAFMGFIHGAKFDEGSMLAVRRLSVLTLHHQRARRTLCISCKMTCSGAVPMAAVFRTPLSRRIGSASSWQGHSPGRNLL